MKHFNGRARDGKFYDVDYFFSKIAGVTFEGRQNLISQLKATQPLMLCLEPYNPYDSFAIAVYDGFSRKLGYLPKDTAKMMYEKGIVNRRIDACVTQITGGQDGLSYGCSIAVRIYR